MNIVKKAFQWLLVLFMIVLFLRAVIFIFGGYKMPGVNPLKDDYIAIVDAEGMILDAGGLISQFQKLEQRDNVKGYILRVNSPGGLVTPSQEIYEYLLTLKKPMYAAMGSVAASGGYMISLPANRIYAMPSTTTGSIGVIMQIPNYSELMQKIGVSQNVIKSGKFKDAGSAERDMTPEERAVLSAVVMDMYGQFVQVVSTRRNLDYAQTERLADGRIYTGRMAQELGLVDRLGSWHDAFLEMKQELNLPDIEYLEVEDDDDNPFGQMIGKIPEYFGVTKTTAGSFYYMMEF